MYHWLKCSRLVGSTFQCFPVNQQSRTGQLSSLFPFSTNVKYDDPLTEASVLDNGRLEGNMCGSKSRDGMSLSIPTVEDNKLKNERIAPIPGLEKYSHGDFHVPSFPPSFNFAAYVNDSPNLQELVKLGVSLYKWEKRKGIAEFILKLDFRCHMAPFIRFLHDVGVPANKLGEFLTENPLIFKEDINDLAVRINYLESKRFSTEMISRIISTNPYWLMFSTKRIDRRLGHFQKHFHLSGTEVRQLAVKQPNLITYNMHHIKTNTFVLKEELGLEDKELKKLLLMKPKLWMIDQIALKERFEYVHLDMKIPHELIIKSPEILGSRLFRVKERHLFLKSLKRDQYNPSAEGYVSLKSLISCSDAQFAVNIANSSMDTYNMFLKTL